MAWGESAGEYADVPDSCKSAACMPIASPAPTNADPTRTARPRYASFQVVVFCMMAMSARISGVVGGSDAYREVDVAVAVEDDVRRAARHGVPSYSRRVRVRRTAATRCSAFSSGHGQSVNGAASNRHGPDSMRGSPCSRMTASSRSASVRLCAANAGSPARFFRWCGSLRTS